MRACVFAGKHTTHIKFAGKHTTHKLNHLTNPLKPNVSAGIINIKSVFSGVKAGLNVAISQTMVHLWIRALGMGWGQHGRAQKGCTGIEGVEWAERAMLSRGCVHFSFRLVFSMW